MKIVISAVTEDGYRREIFVADERQIRMTNAKLQEVPDGHVIHPKEFPEASKFLIEYR